MPMTKGAAVTFGVCTVTDPPISVQDTPAIVSVSTPGVTAPPIHRRATGTQFVVQAVVVAFTVAAMKYQFVKFGKVKAET